MKKIFALLLSVILVEPVPLPKRAAVKLPIGIFWMKAMSIRVTVIPW